MFSFSGNQVETKEINFMEFLEKKTFFTNYIQKKMENVVVPFWNFEHVKIRVLLEVFSSDTCDFPDLFLDLIINQNVVKLFQWLIEKLWKLWLEELLE